MNLKLYDPFNQQKINSFTSGLPAMQHLSKYLLSIVSNSPCSFEEFASLLKVIKNQTIFKSIYIFQNNFFKGKFMVK